jgi:diaminopimelate decarboxylase
MVCFMPGIEERKEEVGMVLVLKRARRAAAMGTLVTDSMAQERCDLLPTHLPDAQIDVHLDLTSAFNPELLQKLVCETPFFLFSKNQILHNFHEFKKFFPESLIHYAIKANSEPEVLQTLVDAESNKENLVPLLLRAKELGLHPYGISFHVGGYPCQYATSGIVPHLEEIAGNILKQYNQLPYHPKLLLEPGRGIIANTGILIASVIARVERKGKTWLFLDAGVYNGLFEAMAYQGSTRYPITSMRSGGDAGEAFFAIAGPTGDSPDIITKEAVLPRDIQVGDKLIIHNVGAYSLVTSCPFNGFPKPAVYYI